MGMSYRRYLSGARIYGCSTCRTHLATIHSMISRVRPSIVPHSCLSAAVLTHGCGVSLGVQRATWTGIPVRWSVSLLSRRRCFYDLIVSLAYSLAHLCTAADVGTIYGHVGRNAAAPFSDHPRHACSVNVVEGEPNDRQMTTGNHTVRDIYCVKCGTTLGWKYVCGRFL